MASKGRTAGTSQRLLDVGVPLFAGLVGAAIFGALAWRPLLPGVVLIVLLVACSLLVPIARTLAGRIVTSAVIWSAICYVLWLVPGAWLPREELMAALIGGAGAFSVASAVRRRSPHSLLPRIDVVDLVAAPLTGAAAAWAYAPYTFAATGQDAVSLWARQWDNSSHSFIVIALRHYGQLIRYAPPSPDGTLYALSEYPAAYHVVAETFLRYLIGPSGSDTVAEIHGFVVVVGWLAVLAAVLVACTVAGLPGARRHPLAGCVGAGLAGSVMVAGPGAIAMVDAHYNFPLAVALVAVVMGTVIGASRVWNVRRVAVIVAAVALSAGSWLPLAAVSGLTALGVALPLTRARWRGPAAARIACVAVAAVGVVVCVLQVVWALRGIDGNAVDAGGGIDRVLAHQFTMAIAVLIVGLTWAISRRGRSGLFWGVRSRYAVGCLALLGLCVGYLVLASGQLAEFGVVRYYPMKIQNGFVDLALIALGMSLPVVAGTLPPRAASAGGGLRAGAGASASAAPAGGEARVGLAALVAGAVSLFAFGLPIPSPFAGADTPLTVGALGQTVRARPDLTHAIQVAQTVSPKQYVLVVFSHDIPLALVDTVLVASARGTYSNGTSEWLLRTFPASAQTVPELATQVADDVRARRAVVICAPEDVAQFQQAIPKAPAGSIRS